MQSQDNASATRPIRVKGPDGVGPFLVTRFAGTEGLGRLYEYELELLSLDHEVDFNKLMAQPVTLTIAGDEERPDKLVHGFISRFTQTEPRGRHMEYLATIVPFVWFLTRHADCRIFQEKTVPQIVRQVLSDLGFDDVEDRLRGEYPTWEYCVQYRETDFNFISRLMEQEGIYYYFEHTGDAESGQTKHTMVLCDSASNHEPGKGCAVLPFGLVLSGAQHVDAVSDWAVMHHVHSDQASLIDYNFKKPKTQLRSNQFEAPDYPPPPGEVFDYPGGYIEGSDGDRIAAIRAQQLSLRRTVFRGITDARGLFAGVQFELDGHPRPDQNRNYLVISSSHSGWCDVGESTGAGGAGAGAGGGELYTCSFECIDAATVFRSLRTTVKPLIQGPQTAVVVGPKGEEIHADEFGRVRVIFHWDRVGDPDKGDCSCWMRVAQVWAGKKWGGMFIPRVGHEVIVEFLEGDPDRPIITGRVYNGENGVPYGLPGSKTQSGIKSRSSKGGGTANFNEIRFEDLKGSEDLYIHAEKNETIVVESDKSESVGHDETIKIGNDRTETVGHDETITVHNNRTDTVGVNETRMVGADRSRTVGGSETVTVALLRTHTVGINEAITVGAAQEITIGAAQTLTVGAVQATTIGIDHNMDVGADRATSIGKDDSLAVGKKLAITVGDEITITTGKASITMKKDGTIIIKGKDIAIDASGEIDQKASKNITMKGQKILQN